MARVLANRPIAPNRAQHSNVLASVDSKQTKKSPRASGQRVARVKRHVEIVHTQQKSPYAQKMRRARPVVSFSSLADQNGRVKMETANAAALQLSFLSDSSKTQTLLRGVDPATCRVSRFNTRKGREQEAIAKLAERMLRNGFEMTRALWAYRANDGVLEVFAGGTRLEAARIASVTVDVILHDGYSWEEISRLSDQDNENDEYHTPVKPMDIWAEYARLRDDEGWTQQKIADAKGVARTMVTMRLQWHDGLPKDIRSQVGLSSALLTEFHIQAVFANCQALDILTTWADIPVWRVESLQIAIDKKWSSRQLAQHWQSRIDAIERANALLQSIPDGERDEYRALEEGEIGRASVNWREAFAELLADKAARTVSDVDAAFSALRKRQDLSDERKRQIENNLDAEQRRLREEEMIIDAITARWLHGDSRELIRNLQDNSVRLVLTDPPYGVDFQSNRRVVSGKADKITNDATADEALALFEEVLSQIDGKLADDAHLLIFTHWKTEADFRRIIERHGYTIRGSLVWVKDNHTSGDLECSFAPRHERIIHATKGRPQVTPRIDDVLEYARETTTDHPTEKPVTLLKRLIECTTQHGQLVIDPFAGVASTAIAAHELQREWWACELSEHYWSQGYQRVDNAIRQRVQNELQLAAAAVSKSRARAA